MNIGCIGAGVAGAGVCHQLDSSPVEITIFEQNSLSGGRATTVNRGEYTYDYGANYLKDTDERVSKLITEELSTADLGEIDEPIWTFDRHGTVSEGRNSAGRKLTYVDGISELSRRMLSQMEVSLLLETKIEQIRYRNSQWSLQDSQGETYGPFDALICTIPAPDLADLLRSSKWNSPVRETIASAAEEVSFRSIYSAVLGYNWKLNVSYYALVNTDKAHQIGWISREECKPGHVPSDKTVLIVQANHQWTLDNRTEPSEKAIQRLAERTASVIGDERLCNPMWTDHRYWQHALPVSAPPAQPIERATEFGLYITGDWVVGSGRIHAAIRAGLDTGDRIRNDLLR